MWVSPSPFYNPPPSLQPPHNVRTGICRRRPLSRICQRQMTLRYCTTIRTGRTIVKPLYGGWDSTSPSKRTRALASPHTLSATRSSRCRWKASRTVSTTRHPGRWGSIRLPKWRCPVSSKAPHPRLAQRPRHAPAPRRSNVRARFRVPRRTRILPQQFHSELAHASGHELNSHSPIALGAPGQSFPKGSSPHGFVPSLRRPSPRWFRRHSPSTRSARRSSWLGNFAATSVSGSTDTRMNRTGGPSTCSWTNGPARAKFTRPLFGGRCVCLACFRSSVVGLMSCAVAVATVGGGRPGALQCGALGRRPDQLVLPW